MTARVQIVLDRAEDALYVPIGAVSEEENGTPVVFTRKRGRNPVPVTLGLRNDSHIVVESGVAEGEQVAIIPALTDYDPLGWHVETVRRESVVADVGSHLAKMQELGITGEPIKPAFDLTSLPPFLQGIARMFEEEGEPLTEEQLASLAGLEPGPGMNEALRKVLNEDQLRFMDRMRQQGGENGNIRIMQDGGGGGIIRMGPGGGGGRGR
jgi:hypothetical protein